MKQIISAHNRKVLANIKPPIPVEEEPVPTTCNCSKKKMEETGGCPLQGKCLTTNVVYQAEVAETKVDGKEEVEKYVGCTTDFKTRWRQLGCSSSTCSGRPGWTWGSTGTTSLG